MLTPEKSLQAKLAEHFGNDQFYDKTTKRINLDPLWHSPQTAKSCLKILERFFDRQGWLEKAGGVLVADKVKVPFSILPLVCSIAISRERKLIIWKENADIIHGTSQLFGDIAGLIKTKGTEILICHDVFVHGYALVKILCDLNRIIGDACPMEKIKISAAVNLAGEDEIDHLLELTSQQTGLRLIRSQFDFLADVSVEWSQIKQGEVHDKSV